MPLSNYDIDFFINSRPYKKKYKGILKISEMNNSPFKLIKDKDFHILYLQSIMSNIGHWEMIIRHKNGFLWFTSFGNKENPDSKILNYITKYDNLLPGKYSSIDMNITDLQHTKSYLCGYYCLYIIEKIMKSPSSTVQTFRNVLSDFKKNGLNINHDILYDFFTKLE